MSWFLVLLLALSAGRQSSADGGDYRLPTAFVPTNYRLTVLPHLDADGPPFSFEGSVTITLTVVEASANIVLHAGANLEVSGVTVQLQGSDTPLKVQNSRITDTDREFFQVPLEEAPEVAAVLELTLAFTGQLPTDMKGFYLSSYTHESTTRYLAATKFEPTYARRAFPCFDEPALKATFSLTVVVPSGYSAIAGTQATTASSSNYPDHVEYQFEELPKMSTYLVSWVVYEPTSYAAMTLLTTAGSGAGSSGPWGMASARTLSSEWYLPLRAGQAALRELNTLFDGDLNYYSFMKSLSLVALPDFISGAMENWGMITFRERRLLMSDTSSSTETIQSVATTIAHEIVHQWFGDLVSPAWWSYLWLNEGFATYWSYHLGLALDGTDDWRMGEQFVVLELQAALREDASPSTHPMTYDRTTPEEIQAVFDGINYEKAASVIRMFEHILGTKAFRAALKSYLLANAHDSVTEADLFLALDTELAATPGLQTFKMADVFFSWTNSAGYPLVTLTRNYDDGTASLTQERFYDDPDESTSDGAVPWMVPITMAWSTDMFEDTAPVQFLYGERPMALANFMADSDHWVVINVQQTGYYRVQYDEQNWQQLSAQLRTDASQLHRVSRAQLVDDALALASAGRLSYSVALDLTSYLSREEDPLPWMAALTNFALLHRRLANSDTHQYFMTYLQTLMEPLFERLGGFGGRTDLSHIEAVLYSQLLPWACRVGVRSCNDTAVQEFTWIAESPSRSISANRQAVVYCEGLASSPGNSVQAAFDMLWSQFTDSATPPNEKNTILGALGCITEEAVVHSFLQKVVQKDGIRLQDIQAAFSSVISSPQGAQFALNFLSSNEASVKAVLDEIGKASSVITSLAQWLPSDQQAVLLETVSDWDVAESLKTTIDSLNKWLEKNEPVLAELLEPEPAPTTTESYDGGSSISYSLTLILITLCTHLIFSPK